jgi:hypothetical protein
MKLVVKSTGAELEDAKTLSDLKVQNDDVIGLCYRKAAGDGAPMRLLVPVQLPQMCLCALLHMCGQPAQLRTRCNRVLTRLWNFTCTDRISACHDYHQAVCLQMATPGGKTWT